MLYNLWTFARVSEHKDQKNMCFTIPSLERTHVLTVNWHTLMAVQVRFGCHESRRILYTLIRVYWVALIRFDSAKHQAGFVESNWSLYTELVDSDAWWYENMLRSGKAQKILIRCFTTIICSNSSREQEKHFVFCQCKLWTSHSLLLSSLDTQRQLNACVSYIFVLIRHQYYIPNTVTSVVKGPQIHEYNKAVMLLTTSVW